MTGHRALEKKQITQGNNRKLQNPGGSLKKGFQQKSFFFFHTHPNVGVLCYWG